ncbi:hypothetical protein BBI15_03105 [Planococcus plakortidis]|uniref:Uncharacterized protein n=1 Tax=Planococcus plakortidis TaxID=1038856 RepID=A0A1C7E6B4_9BACL|nr:hypothetical protein [Planococcus plakortidis]ANU19266.1 hypothetical protein BBI15_03105 [Planococcus plakortidis]
MEPLIMMLIIAAVSALFGKDKKKDANQQKGRQTTRQQVPGAPRSAQQRQQQSPTGGQRSFKRIEDYAKEIYGEFQSQMESDPKRAEQARQVKEQAERAKTRAMEEVEKRAPVQAKQAAEQVSRPGRLSAHRQEPLKRATGDEKERDLLPLDGQDVRRGIIMAEILQPPKAKRQKQGRHI